MNRELLTYLDFDKNGCCFFVQKSAKKYEKNKNSVYLDEEGMGREWKRKNKKNKEQKIERNIKRKRKVGSHKIETGAEGALTEGCRKRKAEICSVKKDGAAGDCQLV